MKRRRVGHRGRRGLTVCVYGGSVCVAHISPYHITHSSSQETPPRPPSLYPDRLTHTSSPMSSHLHLLTHPPSPTYQFRTRIPSMPYPSNPHSVYSVTFPVEYTNAMRTFDFIKIDWVRSHTSQYSHVALEMAVRAE